MAVASWFFSEAEGGRVQIVSHKVTADFETLGRGWGKISIKSPEKKLFQWVETVVFFWEYPWVFLGTKLHGGRKE